MTAGVSVGELMERAGAALAEAVWRFGGGHETLVLCGPGNNGGDGYVAARLLEERGLAVRVAALRKPRAPAAIEARKGWTGPVEALDRANAAPVLLDCLFGTGLARPLEPEVAGPLARLRGEARFVIAADLPSGVATDDGTDLGAAAADVTVALAALKPAHLLHPAAGLCGHVMLGDIRIVAASDAAVLQRPALPAPLAGDHKYTRGLVTVIAGAMAGAAALAAAAAQRAGAGYVVLTGDAGQVPSSVVRRTRDAALGDARIGAIVVGCGLGDDRNTLDACIDTGKSLVLDADALTLADLPILHGLGARAILTPHEGEFARLFGALPGNKIDRARAAAGECGCVVILKGADSVIAVPDGRVRVATGLPHWLASAGTGDVLAGIAGAMLARGLAPFDAASAAVWLHGDAARRAGPVLIADDLTHHLPAALAACA
jgi:hydroxyethylthiazole kinase-like uncharacterized protein yjeF